MTFAFPGGIAPLPSGQGTDGVASTEGSDSDVDMNPPLVVVRRPFYRGQKIR
jgi:hypothetical protein